MKGPGVAMRPREALELVDLGFVLVRQQARAVLRAGGPGLLTAAACAALAWLWWPPFGLAVALLGGRLAQGAMTTALGAVASGEAPSAPRRVHDAAVVLRTTLVPTLVCTLFLAAGPLALFFWKRNTWLTEVALLEGEAAVSKRSSALSDAPGAPTWGVRCAGIALELWAAIAAEYSGRAILGGIFQVGEPFGSLVDGDVTPFLLAGVLIAQPWCCAVRLAAYLDARTRAEALDALFDLRTTVAAWSGR